MDSVAGVGVYSANLGWRNFPFKAEAEKRLGIPVAFDHDVRSAAAVEHSFGGSKEFNDVVVMVVGTGIAAAVFSGGKAVTAGGFAGGNSATPRSRTPDAGPDATGSTILEAVAQQAQLPSVTTGHRAPA